MVECRPIHEHESEAFLGLLCDVFHLDRERAASIFYSEPFFDLTRKWALFEEGEMRSILTLTPLQFGFGPAFGIAGVATAEGARRRGLAQRLLEDVLARADEEGLGSAMLFAHETEVYRRVGFEVIDMVVRGPVWTSGWGEKGHSLGTEEVIRRYTEWQKGDERRLVRDQKRWRHWQWVYRSCEPMGPGEYFCYEPLLCREAVLYRAHGSWPVAEGTEWLGLRTLTRELGIPLVSEKEELIVMGRGFGGVVPQMFMTDQF